MEESQSEKNFDRSLFSYDDYRRYLKDRFAQLKRERKEFSYRYFARVAGFKSPSFLKLVMDGKSNLSDDSIHKFSMAFKHTETEKNFFANLVKLNQSTTVEEKKLYAEEILKSRRYRSIYPLHEGLYKFISKWYFIVIKEMVALPSFQEDPHWICSQLKNEITPGEAKKALQEMLELGILARDQQQKLYQVKTFMMTADEVVSSSAAEYHREMMKKAADSIDLVPRQERELGALTLSVSKETAQKLKSMLQQFRKDIMEICTEDQNPDSVYQVNFQLFPLVSTSRKEEKES